MYSREEAFDFEYSHELFISKILPVEIELKIMSYLFQHSTSNSNIFAVI